LAYINDARDLNGLEFDTGITVPAGTYQVTISTSDGPYDPAFGDRKDSDPSVQREERIYVSVAGADSGYTDDLPDEVSVASGTFDVGTITTTGGSLLLRHIGFKVTSIGKVQSVHGRSAVLTPVCAPTTTPPPPVTTPPTTVPGTPTTPPTTAPGTPTTTVPGTPTTPPTTAPGTPTTTPSTVPGTSPTPTTAPPTTASGTDLELPETGLGASMVIVALALLGAGGAMVLVRRKVRPV
jgi:hypothetical protein